MRLSSKPAALPGLAAVLTIALLTPTAHAAGIPVTGRILAPGGAPVAAARVELLPIVGGYRAGKLELEGKVDAEPAATALSNAQGDFRLTAPDLGMWKVVVRVPGHIPMEAHAMPLMEERVLPPLELVPDRGLTVRVLDAGGRPLAGARVRAAPVVYVRTLDSALENGWLPARRIAWTDERGEALLPRIPGEELRLRAFAPGFLESAELVAREAGVALRLAPAGSLEVELVDAEGKPAAGALVAAGEESWPTGISDDRGFLALPAPSSGALRLTIHTPGGTRESTEIGISPEEPAQRGSPVRIPLSPPALLIGRIVRIPDDRPVPGALVWPESDPAAAVRADSRGVYSVINNREGHGSVLASAPGYLQGGTGFEATPAGTRGAGDLGALQLQPAGLLEGRVVDEDGKPVEDARIRADLEQSARYPILMEASTAETRTLADGRFRLPRLLPSESYRLTATRTGFAPVSQTAQSTQGRSAVPVELVLVKGRVVAGKVVDEEGRAVAGARVVLERNKAVATGESGDFEVPNPPTGTYTLAVYRPGFAPLLVPRVEIAEKDLRIELGTLTLRKAAVLEGRVTDPEGKSVAGAKVTAATLAAVVMDRFKGSIEENPGATVTDAEGRFRLLGLHPRERVNLYVQCDGYVPAALGAVRATAGKPLEIVLQPEATISGRVVDEAGASVPNATVRWSPETPKGAQDLRGATGTGPDGSFNLDKLDPGPAQLTAAAEGRGVAEIDLTLEAGQNLKDVVITLRMEGATLEGKVFDSHGRPLAAANVHAMRILPLPGGGSATTDDSGHFRLEGLRLGETTVYASHPESSRSIQRKVLIQPGRNEIDLAFPSGHPVSGRVVNDQGAPVADISVRIDSTDRGVDGCQSTTAADGSFTTCELPDGSYRIHAWSQELGGTPWLPVQVSGRPVTDLELQLQRLGRILGRIRGLQPEQLLWLRIGAFDVKGSEVREGRIGHDGRYEISSLFSGSWEVRLIDTQAPLPPPGTRPGALLGTVTLEPGAGEVAVDFDLPRDVESGIE